MDVYTATEQAYKNGYAAALEELYDMGNNDFAEEVIEDKITDPLEILNWYRNLYYKEPSHTERGIMANAINDLFMKYRKVLL